MSNPPVQIDADAPSTAKRYEKLIVTGVILIVVAIVVAIVLLVVHIVRSGTVGLESEDFDLDTYGCQEQG